MKYYEIVTSIKIRKGKFYRRFFASFISHSNQINQLQRQELLSAKESDLISYLDLCSSISYQMNEKQMHEFQKIQIRAMTVGLYR